MKNVSKGQKLLIATLLIVMVGFGFLFSIWMQSRFSELSAKKSKLAREAESLRTESVLLDLEIHKLSSIERISRIAGLSGLGYENIPKKVMILGERK